MNYEHVQIKVKAFAENLCWSNLFVELKEQEPLGYSIKAFGTFTHNDGGICGAVMFYMDTILYFQPTKAGTYLFHNYITPNNIDVDTMIVK